MKSGMLKQIEGKHVLIDQQWYLVQQPQYIPRDLDQKVEFDVAKSDPNTITYIQKAKGTQSKGTTNQKYPSRNSKGGSNTSAEIRRMSCINSAIAYVDSQDLKLSIDEVLKIAEKIENWEKLAR